MATEGPREVRSALIADQARHVCHRDEALFDQQIGRHPQTPAPQFLAERETSELGVGALELARRAGEGRRDPGQRQLVAVVACHHHPCEQIQASPADDRVLAHLSLSDVGAAGGTTEWLSDAEQGSPCGVDEPAPGYGGV